MNEQFCMVPVSLLKSKCKALDVAVYAALDSFANKQTGECFPSIRTLASILGVSTPTIQKGIINLERYKFIKVERNGIKGNRYFLTYRDKEACNEIAHMYNDIAHVSNEVTQGVQSSYTEVYNDISHNHSHLTIVNEPEKDTVPYQALVASYHEILKDLPRVAKLTEARRASLRARWKENPNLKYWEGIFKDIRDTMPFLMGKFPGRNGHPPFQATLEWIMKDANYTKIIEGKYYAPSKQDEGEGHFVGVGEWLE